MDVPNPMPSTANQQPSTQIGVRAEGRQEHQPIAGSATRRSTATNSTAPAAVAAISACV